MSTLFSSILATFLAAQLQGGTIPIQGKVADEQGKPAANAQVVYFAPRPWTGVGEPVEVATKTDARGGIPARASCAEGAGFLPNLGLSAGIGPRSHEEQHTTV